MQLIRRRAYARAGLVGNPSDGYNGRTISFIVRNLWAEVVLYEWDEIEILWSMEDKSRFRSVQDLVHDVRLHGYYGGVRLVKATIKRFVEYCGQQGLTLHDRNFSIRYSSCIPRNVGLAGSSAIIVATLRALMDFSKENMVEKNGYKCGVYERLDPSLLPPVYVAYCSEFGEPTEVLHNNLRTRFDAGDATVRHAIQTFAGLAQQARGAILNRDTPLLAKLIDTNFDTRRSICQLHSGHVEMIERARATGASAKFAGSGGAIVGTYTDDTMFTALKNALAPIQCVVFKPIIEPDPPRVP